MLFPVDVQILKLKIFFFWKVLQHGVVFFFLFLFFIFVDDLHGAVFHLYHKLLLSYLLVLVNTVDFEICDCLGKLHLAVDVFAVQSVLVRSRLYTSFVGVNVFSWIITAWASCRQNGIFKDRHVGIEVAILNSHLRLGQVECSSGIGGLLWMREGFKNVVAVFLVKVPRIGRVFSSKPWLGPPTCGIFCTFTKSTVNEGCNLALSFGGKWARFYFGEVLNYSIKFVSELVPLTNDGLIGSCADWSSEREAILDSLSCFLVSEQLLVNSDDWL